MRSTSASGTLSLFLVFGILISIFGSPLAVYASDPTLAINGFTASFANGALDALVTVKNISQLNLEFASRIIVDRPGKNSETNGVLTIGNPDHIWTEAPSNFIVLLPNEERQIRFHFFLSSHLSSGPYTLTFQAITQTGELLAGTTKALNVTGDGAFLTLNQNNCNVLLNGVKFNAQVAPPYDAGVAPEAECLVKNPTAKSIMGYEMFHTNALSAFGNYLVSAQVSGGDVLTFAPGESKLVSIKLPVESSPQVYETQLQFVSQENHDDKTSALVPLRWTVKGSAARIVSWNLDKNSYGFLGKAILTLRYFGSPDNFWDGVQLKGNSSTTERGTPLTSGEADVTLRDTQGNDCGSVAVNLPYVSNASLQTQKIPVTITRILGCDNPDAAIVIKEGGAILSAVTPRTVASAGSSSTWIILIGVIVLLLLIIIGVITIRRYGLTRPNKPS